MKKKKYIIFLFIVGAILYLLSKYIIVFNYKYDEKIGIIDTHINNTYDNLIIYKSKYKNNNNDITHGDSLIKFARSLGYKNDIYYYEAVNEDGKIKTENLINALEWMKHNRVNRVNISLSSKHKSEKLEKWIDRNKDIKIYCSYNNTYNSLADYPAMYSNTIASGSNRIDYKNIDKQYKSNKIISINYGILEFFEGNSYLSIYTMMNE